jgi:hypothetical protein
MKRVWITYAEPDNQEGDVDFVVSELERRGFAVTFDRRKLVPGQRLWSQIGEAISNPARCDAWAIVVTAGSICDEACLEELAYATERALQARGAFPLLALLRDFPAAGLPAVLRARVVISLSDPQWCELVQAGIEGVAPGPGALPPPLPYVVEWHPGGRGASAGVEVRPRFSSMAPFMIAVDVAERHSGNVTGMLTGPPGRVPTSYFLQGYWESEEFIRDVAGRHAVWLQGTTEPASPTRSYYLLCDRLPRRLWAGSTQGLLEIRVGSPTPIDLANPPSNEGGHD